MGDVELPHVTYFQLNYTTFCVLQGTNKWIPEKYVPFCHYIYSISSTV